MKETHLPDTQSGKQPEGHNWGHLLMEDASGALVQCHDCRQVRFLTAEQLKVYRVLLLEGIPSSEIFLD